ncbi:hypothetical protein BH09ACT6_BH09ACT6_18710 [soil metagenome]
MKDTNIEATRLTLMLLAERDKVRINRMIAEEANSIDDIDNKILYLVTALEAMTDLILAIRQEHEDVDEHVTTFVHEYALELAALESEGAG